MALINSQGNYLKIDNVKLDGETTYTIYKDEAQRLNGVGEFETSNYGMEVLDLDMDTLSDGTKGIKDNLITIGYEALKGLQKYSDYTSSL